MWGREGEGDLGEGEGEICIEAYAKMTNYKPFSMQGNILFPSSNNCLLHCCLA